MKLWILAMGALLLTRVGFAQDPTLIAKANFGYALTEVYDFVENCEVLRQECQWTPRQATLARAIRFELLTQGIPTLVFQSEREQPGTFVLDGQVRIAKTGSHPKDDIFINTDLITTEHDGKRTPFSIEEAAVTLVHELGHHHHDAVSAPVTHEELDVLGNTIRNFMHDHHTEFNVTSNDVLKLGNSVVTLTEYHTALPNFGAAERSFVYLTGPFGTLDLSDIGENRLTCPKSYYLDELDFQGTPLFFKWKTLGQPRIVENENGFTLKLPIPDASVACLNTLTTPPSEFRVFTDYSDGELSLPFSFVNNDASFLMNDLKFHMTTPPDHHEY